MRLAVVRMLTFSRLCKQEFGNRRLHGDAPFGSPVIVSAWQDATLLPV